MSSCRSAGLQPVRNAWRRLAGLTVGVLSATLALMAPVPAVAGPPSPDCARGTVTSYGPASVNAPITGSVVVGQRLYVSSRFSPVTVAEYDLATRRVLRTFELPTGGGAWGLTYLDGSLYVGTYGTRADLYRIELATEAITRVAALPEAFIFDLAVGNGQIFLGTFNQGRLLSYDPRTDQLRDYGQVMPGDVYVRSVAHVGDTAYVGTGSRGANVVAIDVATGVRTDITPPELATENFVYDVAANDRYVVAGTEPTGYVAIIDRADPSQRRVLSTGTRTVDMITLAGDMAYFSTRSQGEIFSLDLASGAITSLGTPAVGEETRGLSVQGTTLIGTVGSGAVWTLDLVTKASTLIDFQDAGWTGAPEPLQSLIAVGQRLVAGGHFQFTVHDTRTGEAVSAHAPGEPKALVAHKGLVYAAMYPSAEVWSIDPEDPRNTLRHVATLPADARQMRPSEIVADAERGQLLVASEPVYGELGGALTTIDLATGAVHSQRDFVPQQSIRSLVRDESTGIVYVGSAINGGIGSTPTATEAELVAYDPETGSRRWQVVPFPGHAAVADLTLHRGHLIAVGNDGRTALIDPATGLVLSRGTLGAAGEVRSVRGELLGATTTTLSSLAVPDLVPSDISTGAAGSWYTGPHLAPSGGCAVFILRGTDLTAVGVRP